MQTRWNDENEVGNYSVFSVFRQKVILIEGKNCKLCPGDSD